MVRRTRLWPLGCPRKSGHHAATRVREFRSAWSPGRNREPREILNEIFEVFHVKNNTRLVEPIWNMAFRRSMKRFRSGPHNLA